MGVLESIGITLGGKIGGTIWDTATQAYNDWKQGRRKRLAMAINTYGATEILPEKEGVLWGTVYQEQPWEQPIVLSGIFAADPSFVDYAHEILEHHEKVVLLIVIDEESGETLLAEFQFTGYIMTLWPGVYSLYAFIIDPVLDNTLAIGYPAWNDWQDPNPLELEGSGNLTIDFFLFEEDEEQDLYDDDDIYY